MAASETPYDNNVVIHHATRSPTTIAFPCGLSKNSFKNGETEEMAVT